MSRGSNISGTLIHNWQLLLRQLLLTDADGPRRVQKKPTISSTRHIVHGQWRHLAMLPTCAKVQPAARRRRRRERGILECHGRRRYAREELLQLLMMAVAIAASCRRHLCLR